MPPSRAKRTRERVIWLIENFTLCLSAFDEDTPFAGSKKIRYHQATIARRRQFDSATEALDDEQFNKSLYNTLKAWGIGSRGSRLVPLPEFEDALSAAAPDIDQLSNTCIDDEHLDTDRVSSQLWDIVRTLGIVENLAKLVAGSKALHHVLPHLVVPMDRKYTGNFFGWHGIDFQHDQSRCLRIAIESFAAVAGAVNLDEHVGKGWHTSKTKVLDNAVVGYCLLHPK